MVKSLKLFKIKRKSKKFIRHKALVNNISQYSFKDNNIFPTITESSFSNNLDKENDFKDIIIKFRLEKKLDNKEMPDFRFSLLSFFSTDKKEEDTPKFESYIFKY